MKEFMVSNRSLFKTLNANLDGLMQVENFQEHFNKKSRTELQKHVLDEIEMGSEGAKQLI